VLSSNIDEWLLAWHDVGDNRVCDGCIARHGMKPMTLAEWEVYGLPGSGDTECGDNCRCVLFPVGALDVSQSILGVPIEPGADGGAVVGALVYDALGKLMQEWNVLTGGEPLPMEFYSIETRAAREQYLRDLIDKRKAGD
jgi:hypothetical protein